MPQTQQSGKLRKSTAGTGFGSSSSSQSSSSRFDALIERLKGSKITKTKLRDEIFNKLYDDATDQPEEGKWYLFEYDPKFKDQLARWDQFPLIHFLDVKKENMLGANLHYINTNARLRAINNKKFPTSTLHYYIPKRADAIFFEIKESEVQLLSQLPLEKFHRNR